MQVAKGKGAGLFDILTVITGHHFLRATINKDGDVNDSTGEDI